jgi:hypothetical protein
MKQLKAQFSEKPEKLRLPLLPLITFSPMGNPLSSLSTGQCNLFFDYLLRSLHDQRVEQTARIAALLNKPVVAAVISGAALHLSDRLSSVERMHLLQRQKDESDRIIMQEKQGKGGADGRKGGGKSQPANALKEDDGEKDQGGQDDGEEKYASWREVSLDELLNEKRKEIADYYELGGGGAASGAKFTVLLHKKGGAGAQDSAKRGAPATLLPKTPPMAGGKKVMEGKQASDGDEVGGAPIEATVPIASQCKVEQGKDEKYGGSGTLGPSFHSAFGQRAPSVAAAIGQLALMVDDYARGNEEKEKSVVDGLHKRLRRCGYLTDDLAASLLMVIEDDAWSGEEGGLGLAKPKGGANRLFATVPRKLRSTAQDSAEIRLASVREMLRYYFLNHPEEYHSALAAALGITSDQEEDITFLQERMAFMLASIGSFALAQKILEEIKKKNRMDTKECLLQLGYRYNVKKRRLVLGKRTCGGPAEARGIIGLLIASMRK